jgi:predicted type IV restriction endonuclease
MEGTTAPAQAAPRWETTARERVRAAIRRYTKPLEDLHGRDANEGDTRLLVTDFLCDALGFDKYADLTTEYQVKGEFADYGIRVDQDLVAFIEVKRVTTKLNARHLRQAEMYAVNEGVEWVILTNESQWQAYHLDVSKGLPVVMDLVLDVDLLSEVTVAKKTDALFYLAKESFKRRRLNDLWVEKAATSPKALAALVLSAPVVETMRKELRKASGQRVEPAEIASLLQETVIRPECLNS